MNNSKEVTPPDEDIDFSTYFQFFPQELKALLLEWVDRALKYLKLANALTLIIQIRERCVTCPKWDKLNLPKSLPKSGQDYLKSCTYSAALPATLALLLQHLLKSYDTSSLPSPELISLLHDVIDSLKSFLQKEHIHI